MKQETSIEEMSEKVFTTKSRESASKGIRITLTMEATSDKGMDWAMAQAFQFARERWMGVTVHHKDDPTARASCRTTRLRERNSHQEREVGE